MTEQQDPENAAMAQMIFTILSGKNHKVIMYDPSGKRVFDPSQANRLFCTDLNMMVQLGYTKGSSQKPSVTFHTSATTPLRVVEEIRNTLRQHNSFDHSFNLMPYGKNLQPKNFQNMNKTEVTESAWTGSTRTSRWKTGVTEVVIRHNQRLEDSENPRRWTRIADIFIHGADGSRYKFPYRHILGAKAMAQHLDQQGAPWDETGNILQDILDLTMQVRKLKRWATNNQPNCLDAIHNLQRDIKHMLHKISQPNSYAQAVDQAKQMQPTWQQVPVSMDITWPQGMDKAVSMLHSYLPHEHQPTAMDHMDYLEPEEHNMDQMDQDDQAFPEARELNEWFGQFDVGKMFEQQPSELEKTIAVDQEQHGKEDPRQVYQDVKDDVMGLINTFEKDPQAALGKITKALEKVQKLKM